MRGPLLHFVFLSKTVCTSCEIVLIRLTEVFEDKTIFPYPIRNYI